MTYTVSFTKGYVTFTDNATAGVSYSFNVSASTFQFTANGLLIVRDGVNGISFKLTDITNVASLYQLLQLIPNPSQEALAAYQDMFGRLRVSEPHSLFSANETHGLTTTGLSFETAGNGTATLNAYDSSMDLSCTATQRIVRQSKHYITYQPGKSNLAKITGVLRSTYTPLAVYKLGVFDDNTDKSVTNGFPDRGGDGHFFQYTNGVLSVVQRTSTSGAPYQSDTAVTQANFNIDKLDGTGPSGFTLDTTKANIYFIAREWLGVGEVLMGVVSGVKFLPCHQFNNSNTRTSTYMKTASLPVRYEVDNTLGADPAAMKQICSCVESEGGYNPQGRIFSTDLGTTLRTLPALNVELPLIALRLKQNYVRSKVLPLQTCVIAGNGNTNNQIYIRVVVDATVNAGAWSDYDATNSNVQVNKTCTSITGGRVVASGYVNAGQNPLSLAENPDLPLVSGNIAGTSGTLVLCATHCDVGTRDVFAAVQWREFD